MLATILVLQLIANIDCSFRGGFEKGLKDFESGTYGADPDRFCYGDLENKRESFLEAYELGRDNSYLFSKVGMTTVPKDRSEFQELLKEVRSLKIQLDATANKTSPKASPSVTPEPLPTAP